MPPLSGPNQRCHPSAKLGLEAAAGDPEPARRSEHVPAGPEPVGAIPGQVASLSHRALPQQPPQGPRRVRKRSLTARERDAILGRISPTLDDTGFRHVDFAIEAVPEILDLKQEVFVPRDEDQSLQSDETEKFNRLYETVNTALAGA